MAACGPADEVVTENWQLFDGNWQGLRLTLPQVEADTQVSLLVLNAGNSDNAQVEIEVAGLAPAIERGQALTASAAFPNRELLQSATGIAQLASAPIDERDSFCVLRDLNRNTPVRRQAVLVHQTETSRWYVDADDRAFFEELGSNVWPSLASQFDQNVFPVLTDAIGPPGDVDRDGHVSLFFTRAMGSGWAGYFDAVDITAPRDDSPDCSRGRGNGGEVLFVGALRPSGISFADLIRSYYPSAIAHELTHLLHFQQRCGERVCHKPEETWITEGLAKAAEDLVGGGWNLPAWRSVGAQLLGGGYAEGSLTRWEGATVANYELAHAVFRFWGDVHGAQWLGEIARSESGRAKVEATLGRPLSQALAEAATALMFSNQGVDARFNFTGAAWSPLHQKIGRFSPQPLATGRASIRPHGWRAFAGSGSGSSAVIWVSGGATQVVVVQTPATGSLARNDSQN